MHYLHTATLAVSLVQVAFAAVVPRYDGALSHETKVGVVAVQPTITSAVRLMRRDEKASSTGSLPVPPPPSVIPDLDNGEETDDDFSSTSTLESSAPEPTILDLPDPVDFPSSTAVDPDASIPTITDLPDPVDPPSATTAEAGTSTYSIGGMLGPTTSPICVNNPPIDMNKIWSRKVENFDPNNPQYYKLELVSFFSERVIDAVCSNTTQVADLDSDYITSPVDGKHTVIEINLTNGTVARFQRPIGPAHDKNNCTQILTNIVESCWQNAAGGSVATSEPNVDFLVMLQSPSGDSRNAVPWSKVIPSPYIIATQSSSGHIEWSLFNAGQFMAWPGTTPNKRDMADTVEIRASGHATKDGTSIARRGNDTIDTTDATDADDSDDAADISIPTGSTDYTGLLEPQIKACNAQYGHNSKTSVVSAAEFNNNAELTSKLPATYSIIQNQKNKLSGSSTDYLHCICGISNIPTSECNYRQMPGGTAGSQGAVDDSKSDSGDDFFHDVIKGLESAAKTIFAIFA